MYPTLRVPTLLVATLPVATLPRFADAPGDASIDVAVGICHALVAW